MAPSACPRLYQWSTPRWAAVFTSAAVACRIPLLVSHRTCRYPSVSRADGQRRLRLQIGRRVRRHGAVRIFANRTADGDSTTRDALPDTRVHRAGCFRGPAKDGHYRMGCGPSTGKHARPSRSRPLVVAHHRFAVERRTGTAPFSRLTMAAVSRSSHGQCRPPADLSRRLQAVFEKLGQHGF